MSLIPSESLVISAECLRRKTDQRKGEIKAERADKSRKVPLNIDSFAAFKHVSSLSFHG